MNQKRYISDFLLRFILTSVCFFLFAVISSGNPIQNRKQVSLEYVQNTLKSNQEFVSVSPLKLPKYSDEQVVIDDLKQIDSKFYFTHLQHTIQVNRALKRCMITNLFHEHVNSYVNLKSHVLMPPDDGDFLVS